MQTLHDIQSLLRQANSHPRKQFGQNFLIDQNLMRKLLDLADIPVGATVLEVGPGTGSLSEELLAHAGRVVLVEIDRDLAALLDRRFAGEDRLTVLQADALASKTRLNPLMCEALAPAAQLVANLPYNIATPLVADCLCESWRSQREEGVRFDRLTFTVQKEVAERFAADAGSRAYGPVSVLSELLGQVRLGTVVPATAFWPKPQIASQMVRIDFEPDRAGELADLGVLQALLHQAFTQRRKRVATSAKARGAPFGPDVLGPALAAAGVDPTSRPEQITPSQWRETANHLAADGV
jgi:16S rRNA (adenine1518-N6/adenine1519-N6)-dimethyltransferase